MTTVYPGSIDSFTNPAPTDPRTSPSHAAQHSDVNDAIEAIETELGTNPSGSFSTLKDRLTPNSIWDGEIVKATSDTQTNQGTPQNDSELNFAVAASSVYMVEFWIIYSGNDTTGDYAWRFDYPTLSLARQAQGWYSCLTTADASQFSASLGSTTQWPSGNIGNGTDASHSKFVMHGRFTVVTNGSGTCHFQFCNASAASGRESKTWIGSRLRYKKLA